MGPRVAPRTAGWSAGTPTGAPQRGHTERRVAISSRARRCFPQRQINLMDMSRSFRLSPATRVGEGESGFVRGWTCGPGRRSTFSLSHSLLLALRRAEEGDSPASPNTSLYRLRVAEAWQHSL